MAGTFCLQLVLAVSLPALRLGNRVLHNADFYQYAARYEAVRKSLLEHGAFPLRSHWFGGGFPTLADPEDPTLSPLLFFPLLLGTVPGMKAIAFLAMLIAAGATYGFARSVLGYSRWAACFSAAVYGVSLFLPTRVADGNINEVYAGFVPLVLWLVGRAVQGSRVALFLLPAVLYTMLSDGKLTFFMAIFFVGLLCALELVPGWRVLSWGAGGGGVDLTAVAAFCTGAVCHGSDRGGPCSSGLGAGLGLRRDDPADGLPSKDVRAQGSLRLHCCATVAGASVVGRTRGVGLHRIGSDATVWGGVGSFSAAAVAVDDCAGTVRVAVTGLQRPVGPLAVSLALSDLWLRLSSV